MSQCMLSSLNTSIATESNDWVPLAFNGTEQTTYDPNGWHSDTENNTQIRPMLPGFYRLTGAIRFDDNGSGVSSGLTFGVNGILVAGREGFFARDTETGRRSAMFSCIVAAHAGDYFELYASQDSGSNLGLQGFHFQVEHLG